MYDLCFRGLWPDPVVAELFMLLQASGGGARKLGTLIVNGSFFGLAVCCCLASCHLVC